MKVSKYCGTPTPGYENGGFADWIDELVIASMARAAPERSNRSRVEIYNALAGCKPFYLLPVGQRLKPYGGVSMWSCLTHTWL